MNLLNLGAIDIGQFCSEMGEVLQLVGYILLIFKIAIPILIIALGMFDFGKAVVAEKEDEIKKQTKRLIYRVIAGIVIFFIPSLVMLVFKSVNGYNDAAEGAGFQNCEACILRPNSKDCKTN